MTFLKATLPVLSLCALNCLAVPYNRQHPAAGYYAPAPIGHDGRVIDTPEVAQAKAAHLAAFSRLVTPQYPSAPVAPQYLHAQQQPAAGYHHAPYASPSFFTTRVEHGPYGYRGPPAPLAQDGRVIDTPEVAQAKAAHFEAFSQAASRAYNAPAANSNNNDVDYNDYQPSSGAYRAGNNDDEDDGSSSDEGGHYEATSHYQGPPAPLAQDGRVIDTPEVAHAKAAHLAALQRAGHHTHRAPYVPHRSPQGYYGDY